MIAEKEELVRPDEFRAMAKSIAKVSDAAQQLLKSGLSEYALVTLLHASTKVPQRDVKAVLQGLNSLGVNFLSQAYRDELRKAKESK